MSAPWLLLRGLMRETRHWGDFPARLAAAGQTSTYTLDLAGNGLLKQLALMQSQCRHAARQRHCGQDEGQDGAIGGHPGRNPPTVERRRPAAPGLCGVDQLRQ